jgi:hypothetical protein
MLGGTGVGVAASTIPLGHAYGVYCAKARSSRSIVCNVKSNKANLGVGISSKVVAVYNGKTGKVLYSSKQHP